MSAGIAQAGEVHERRREVGIDGDGVLDEPGLITPGQRTRKGILSDGSYMKRLS